MSVMMGKREDGRMNENPICKIYFTYNKLMAGLSSSRGRQGVEGSPSQNIRLGESLSLV